MPYSSSCAFVRALILLLVFAGASVVHAKPVDLITAKRVAATQHERVMSRSSTTLGARESTEMILADKAETTVASGEIRTVYYVFNTSDEAFVIVAGDDAVAPILGYSTEGVYSAANPSPEFIWWMKQYETQIVEVINSGYQGSQATRQDWGRLLEGKGSPELLSSDGAQSVGPLLRTEWGQGEYYNTLCPYDAGAGERTVTGCVATSFAQIMKYHGAPAKGRGDHSYTHGQYGHLYANFANATYNWSAMPNKVTSANSSVATLMYHVGVAIDMGYGPASTGGSGAWPSDGADALQRYFGYEASAREVVREQYTDPAWLALIRSELDAERPVEYHGYGNGSGHSFVCDGYQGDYFHMNWGWDGYYDGYFLLSSLVPDGVGTGGGSGSFNDNQAAVIGITPGVASASQIDIRMNSSITANPNPVSANGIVAVNFDVINAAARTFRGDYCVALFDENLQFVTFIGGILEGAELASQYHYTNGITVRDTLFGLYTGSYLIGIYARPTGGEWTVAGNVEYANGLTLEVIEANYGNDLDIYSEITVSPDPIRVGQPFQVNVDFANRGDFTFEGRIGAFAYTLDGESVGVVAIRTDLQLEANNHWTNGLMFSSTGLDVEPGRYMIMFFSAEVDGEWVAVNPDEYRNPAIVEVLPPALVADRYEDNNSPATAYQLPLSFGASTLRVNTSGSNHHISGDDDYYKVVLSAGYEYDIVAHLRDVWNDSASGYTTDAAVLWNSGDGWSDVFDDTTDMINVTGGRTVQFKVQPLFSGTIGTYQLDVTITRRASASTGQETDLASRILKAYPSPATDHLYIDPIAPIGSLIDISLVDALGNTVYSSRGVPQSTAPIRVELTGQPSGTYLLVVASKGHTYTRMVKVQR